MVLDCRQSCTTWEKSFSVVMVVAVPNRAGKVCEGVGVGMVVVRAFDRTVSLTKYDIGSFELE